MRHPKTGYVKAVKGSPDLYYVRAVPKDLQAAVKKTKWSIPLGTANQAKALQKARAYAVEHDALIEHLRRPDPMESLSSNERKEISERGGLEAYREWLKDLPRQISDLEDEGEGFKEWATTETPAGPEQESHRELQVDPVWALGKAEAALTEAKAYSAALASGMALISKVEDLKSTAPALAEAAGGMIGVDPLTFRELCEKYLIARNPRDKGAFRNVAETFETVNARLLLKDITKQHVRTYRDSISATGCQENTGFGRFRKLKAMFRFAVLDDYIPQNPAENLPWQWPFTQSIAEAADKARRTFSHEEAGRYLKAAESLPLTNRTRWFIFMMMFSGARGQEIAQLSPDDIVQIGRVWCMSIHDREWRTLKTEGSLRIVPLHKIIIEQGFLNFVASRKGKQLIFSDRLATKETDCYARNAESVRKLLRQTAKIDDSRVVPYSSRHTVKDCLRLVRCPRYDQDRILGHTSGKTKTSDEYGEAQILILKKWIDRINPLDKRRNTTAFKEDDD